MDNNLKSINLFRFNGVSININDKCISHTNFHPGQVLEAAIYENMIVITHAIEETTKN